MEGSPKPHIGKRHRLILREGSWNPRFHLSSIPSYDPFKDIHCQNYRHSLAKNKVVYLRSGTLSRNRSKRRRLGGGLPQSSPALELPPSTVEELVKLWGVKAVPVEQQSAFLAVIESLAENQKTAVVAEEMELVRRDRSLAQQVDRLVLNREDCITNLKALVQAYERDGVASKASIDQIAYTLALLRDLTMQTLLSVQSWRQYLYSLNSNNHRILKLPYIWEGENYVLKLRNDTTFLRDSAIARLFEFSKRSDPFLLFPNYAYKQHKGHTRKMDLPLLPSSQEDIKICEGILLEEILNGKEVDRTFRRESITERKGKDQQTGGNGDEAADNQEAKPPTALELLNI